MWQQLAMMKQMMSTQNPEQELRKLAGNDPRLNGLLNQLEALTPEQRKNKLNEMMGQMGISEKQLKSFLGYK